MLAIACQQAYIRGLQHEWGTSAKVVRGKAGRWEKLLEISLFATYACASIGEPAPRLCEPLLTVFFYLKENKSFTECVSDQV